MPDDSGRSFLSAIPLPGLIAVLTGVMGTVLWQYEPLTARRPADTAKDIASSSDTYLIDTTLYEDPFTVIAQTTFKEPQQPPTSPRKTRSYRTLHKPETVVPQDSDRKRLLVLPVFMKPGADRVTSEGRSRTRLAVIEGLASSGYIPKNNKIECCQFSGLFDNKDQPLVTPGLEIPFERFVSRKGMPQIAPSGTHHDRADHVLVLWLPGDSMERSPIIKLQRILSLIFSYHVPLDKANWDAPPPRVVALGPHSTGALVNMTEEARSWSKSDTAPWPYPIELISHSATAPASFILGEANIGTNDEDNDPEATLRSKLNEVLGEDAFSRTIITDDLVAKALVKELEIRGVAVRGGCDKNTEKDTSHIAIISEFNTPYGRAFPELFLKAAGGDIHNAAFNQPDSRWHWFNFPRGLDGRSATGSPPAESSGKDKSKPEVANERTYAPGDIPDGPNQADALRRMAEELRQLDKRLADRKEGHIQAIGLMGGDVFDKLWLLRALKPHFPRAIFFTDNLDAWLWQKDEIRSTRNLVVASPYGLSLGPRWQMGKAPFRESYQTSAYASTLAATGALDLGLIRNQPEKCRSISPIRLYEIGAKGPHDLSAERSSKQPPGIHPEPEVRPNSKWYNWILGSLTIISLAALLYWSIPEIGRSVRWWQSRKADQVKKPTGPADLSENPPLHPAVTSVSLPVPERAENSDEIRKGIRSSLGYYVTHPFLWVIPIICVSIFLTHELWRGLREDGEPFHLLSGISGWPAIAFRITAILLAAHLTGYLLKVLKENANHLDTKFFNIHGKPKKEQTSATESAPPAPAGVKRSSPTKSKWLVDVWMWCSHAPRGKDEKMEPHLLWSDYRNYTGNGARCFRAACIFTLLAALHLSLWLVFDNDLSPIRGHDTRDLADALNFFSSLAFLWVSALVIDAMWSGRMFAYWMNSKQTEWQGIEEKYEGISNPSACDHLDMQVIAERTRPIVAFAFFPFYILALLILSRCELFDHWIWPSNLIVSYVIPIALVLIAAQLMRAEAENIRTHLLNALHQEQTQIHPPKDSPVVYLIGEVKGLKTGAFSPISEQPVMRGIYWLLSALGISGLWQYFSHVL